MKQDSAQPSTPAASSYIHRPRCYAPFEYPHQENHLLCNFRNQSFLSDLGRMVPSSFPQKIRCYFTTFSHMLLVLLDGSDCGESIRQHAHTPPSNPLHMLLHHTSWCYIAQSAKECVIPLTKSDSFIYSVCVFSVITQERKEARNAV